MALSGLNRNKTFLEWGCVCVLFFVLFCFVTVALTNTSAQADGLKVIITEPKELGLGAWGEHIFARFLFSSFWREQKDKEERVRLSCLTTLLATHSFCFYLKCNVESVVH